MSTIVFISLFICTVILTWPIKVLNWPFSVAVLVGLIVSKNGGSILEALAVSLPTLILLSFLKRALMSMLISYAKRRSVIEAQKGIERYEASRRAQKI